MQLGTSRRAVGPAGSPLELLAARMRELPSLPGVALEALHALDDERYDVRAVARTVSRDPALALRIVSMGNSPFFSMGARTSCVKTALLRLGEQDTRSTILSVAIMNVFPVLPPPLDARRFWSFGLASAICARRLARDLGHPDQSAAYLGALVHRLGEAFLAVSFPRRVGLAWRRARRENTAMDEALFEEFGVWPGELCARALESWELDPCVVHAVRECRTPETATREPMLSLVLWTAGWLATELGLGLDRPTDERNVWQGELTPHMRRELHELGYAHTLGLLLSSGDFVAEVRRLGRLVAGRPNPIARARAALLQDDTPTDS